MVVLPFNVIVTTESKQIRYEMEQYQRQGKAFSLRDGSSSSGYKFITNPNDVTQDTGYFDDNNPTESLQGTATNNSSYTANDIMLSTLSSMQLQLYATDLTVGNCGLNFHLIIKDLLNIGCGTASRPYISSFNIYKIIPIPIIVSVAHGINQ